MIINLIEFRISGVFYNCEIEDLEQMENHLESDDFEVILKTEPENEKDDKAVALCYDGMKIGFVPKSYNELIFNMLDNRLNVFCQVLQIQSREQKVFARLYLNTDILINKD